MRRRRFLEVLGAGAVGLVLDPELALWRQGAKTCFFLPGSRSLRWATLDDLETGISMRFVKPPFDPVNRISRVDLINGRVWTRLADAVPIDVQVGPGIELAWG